MTAAGGLGLTAGTALAAPVSHPAPHAVTRTVAPAVQPSVRPAAVPTQVITPDTAASVRRAWEARGRPHRMVIVRDYRLDLAVDGRVTRQVGRAGGTVTIADLNRA